MTKSKLPYWTGRIHKIRTLALTNCFLPVMIQNMVCRTVENGVQKGWSIDVMKTKVLVLNRTDLFFLRSFRAWIASSTGPHDQGSDAIYFERPLIPNGIANHPGSILDPNEAETSDENMIIEGSAALHVSTILEGMKGQKITIRLIAKYRNGKNLKFTNYVFNEGQVKRNLHIKQQTVGHDIVNNTKVHGRHKNVVWGFFSVDIVGTERTLGSHNTKSTGVDGDAAAKAYASA